MGTLRTKMRGAGWVLAGRHRASGIRQLGAWRPVLRRMVYGAVAGFLLLLKRLRRLCPESCTKTSKTPCTNSLQLSEVQRTFALATAPSGSASKSDRAGKSEAELCQPAWGSYFLELGRLARQFGGAESRWNPHQESCAFSGV